MPKHPRQPGVTDDADHETKPTAKKARSGITFTSSRDAKPASKLIKQNQNQKRGKLIVGVEFGTTFSGVAFVMSLNSEPRDIRVITDWPGSARKHEQLEKIPTRIAYASENEGLDQNVFGYEVEPHHKSYSWFKLLLDASARPSEFDNHQLQSHMGNGLMRLPSGKSAQDVAADFLRFVHGHTLHKLEKVYGTGTLDLTPIQWWVTVPATWEDESREATRAAAIQAGLGSRKGDEIYMITEPEAAGMAILTDALQIGSQEYKTNTTILVVDSGGGTSDLQAQTITNTDPLRTEEACAGEGGKCGSINIDIRMREWLEETFSKDIIGEISPSKLSAGSEFMESWEVVKRSFTGDMKKVYRLRLRALDTLMAKRGITAETYDAEDGEVLISGANVANCFQPTMNNILGLVEDYVQRLKKEKKSLYPKVIASCGGLGSSEYVWKVFKAHCDTKYKGKIQVLTDERAWSCVVRGAVIRGLEGSMVLSKKARRAYGMGVHQVFQEGVDEEDDSFMCPIGGKRAPGYINYFFHKGKRFTANFKGESKVYVTIPPNPDQGELKFCWDLYQSAKDNPGVRIDDEDVERAGTIHLDLSKVLKAQKTFKTADEQVRIKVVAKLGGVEGILCVEAFHDKTCVGKAQIDFKKSQRRNVVTSAGLL